MTIAMYIRLSKADEDRNQDKKESNSVVNQRKLLKDFIWQNFTNFTLLEFVDDGYSGTKDNRPKLKEMLALAQKKKIDVVCVKDLSRFFRDYVQAGEYLDCVFPFLGIRFISVNDGYDSDSFKGSTGGMEVAMRNIVHSAYSKDISLKVATAKRQRAKEGKFIGSHAPFGYEKSPENKNQLVIDENASKIVREIFNLALKNCSTKDIAKTLNMKKTPTRSAYFKQKFPDNKKYQSVKDNISWTATRVHELITNRVYMGDLVSCKNSVVAKSAHQAIISREDFQKVQLQIAVGIKNPTRIYDRYPLKKLVKCSNCGYLMQRVKKEKANIFICNNARNGSSNSCDIELKINEKKLEKVILNLLETLSKLLVKRKAVKKESNYNINLYEKYTKNLISEEQYLKEKNKQKAKESLAPLSPELSNAFIKTIYIKSQTEIEINMKITDCFR